MYGELHMCDRGAKSHERRIHKSLTLMLDVTYSTTPALRGRFQTAATADEEYGGGGAEDNAWAINHPGWT